MNDPLDTLFGALADPTRRALLSTLVRQGPHTATQLSDGQPMTRQAIVKHLQALAEAGLVASSREGREVLYRATTAELKSAVDWLLTTGTQWDDRTDRLRAATQRRSSGRRSG